MIRYYHLIARSTKTGKTTRLTRYAMMHSQCMTMKSKITERKERTIELEEVTSEIVAARAMKSNGYIWAYDENFEFNGASQSYKHKQGLKMELDITDFFNNAAPKDYSASRVEIGDNAGTITWKAACDDSEEYPLLDDEEKKEAFRVFIEGFGAWDAGEIAAMDNVELNALCIQLVAGDIREAGLDVPSPDWLKYESSENAGRIYKGGDGKIYFSIDG